MAFNIEQPPIKTNMSSDGKSFTYPWQKWFTQLSDKVSTVYKSIGPMILQYVSADLPIISTETATGVKLSHATSGVTAGSYQSVSVNETGHVVGGSNSTHNPLYLCEAGHEADLTTVRIWNDSGVVKMQMQSIVGTWDIELWRFERVI
jgi:hypothetical protein